jgi:hypothetical protein
MKSDNIVKKLQKEGYSITFKKWGYWDGVPHVELDGFDFTIAKIISKDNRQSCRVDFIYNEVRQALYIAEQNNPVFLKKIEKAPSGDWYYSRYLIRNMGDYEDYEKKRYPFNEYYQVLEKLKTEME